MSRRRLAWATDVYLNFLSSSELAAFFRVLAATDADAIRHSLQGSLLA